MKGIKFLSLSKKKAPVPAAPKGPTPKTLLLPEILDRIFLFIDDDALHRSIILVCRQWLSMNQHRLIREIALIDDNNNRNKAIIARLPRATHLVWHSMDGRLKEKETRKLIQALQENKEFYLQSLQSATQEPVVNNNSNNRKDGLFNPGNKSPFSKNVLRDFNLNGPGPLFISILPYLISLTTLRLHLLRTETLRMDSILQTCPRLHSLHIEVPVVFYLPGSWTPSLGAAPEPEPGQYNSTFSLQSLILENASFAQTSLEDLLVLTPRLTCLQLRNLRPDTTAADNSSYSWSSLFHQLTALSLTLRSVHFSVHNQAMSEEEVHEKTLVVCPRSTDWVFRSLDFTPSLTACLEQLPNMVTTLELISSDGQLVDDHAFALHQYLCASPHLLHLKASQSLCLIERMDVHHRWFPSIRAEATEDRRAGIWACRNLRTLHIRVHNLGSPATQKSTIRPRILFGYISTVLPQLRDLYLYEHENDPGLSLDLMGGLVLLARLRHLEVFRLGTGNTPQEIRPGDVRWMGPAGQNQDGREERTNIVRTWSKVLAAERIAELSRLEAAAQNTAPGYLDAEPEVIEGLNGLGLLSDVKTLVDRMNSQKGYQSWPRLKYLSVYQPGPAARPKMYKVEEGVRQLMMSNSMPVDRGGNNNNIAIMMCGDLSDAISTAIRGRVE